MGVDESGQPPRPRGGSGLSVLRFSPSHTCSAPLPPLLCPSPPPPLPPPQVEALLEELHKEKAGAKEAAKRASSSSAEAAARIKKLEEVVETTDAELHARQAQVER